MFFETSQVGTSLNRFKSTMSGFFNSVDWHSLDESAKASDGEIYSEYSPPR